MYSAGVMRADNQKETGRSSVARNMPGCPSKLEIFGHTLKFPLYSASIKRSWLHCYIIPTFVERIFINVDSGVLSAKQ